MSDASWSETIKVEGGQILKKLEQAIREGNVRRIRIKQAGQVVAEFPLTVGVVGAVFAPVLAAIGAIVALAADCSIEIERATPATPEAAPVAPETPAPEPEPAAAVAPDTVARAGSQGRSPTESAGLAPGRGLATPDVPRVPALTSAGRA